MGRESDRFPGFGSTLGLKGGAGPPVFDGSGHPALFHASPGIDLVIGFHGAAAGKIWLRFARQIIYMISVKNFYEAKIINLAS
jgi:hypothetical protein